MSPENFVGESRYNNHIKDCYGLYLGVPPKASYTESQGFMEDDWIMGSV